MKFVIVSTKYKNDTTEESQNKIQARFNFGYKSDLIFAELILNCRFLCIQFCVQTERFRISNSFEIKIKLK